jgi:uncharacterized protein YcbK (DUF882 family)
VSTRRIALRAQMASIPSKAKPRTLSTKHSLTVALPQIRQAYKTLRNRRDEFNQLKQLQSIWKNNQDAEIAEIKRRRAQKKMMKEQNRKHSEIVQVVCSLLFILVDY